MQRPEFAQVTPLNVEHYPRGQAATNAVPGDFILVHGHSFISGLIRLGEALRIHGADRTYAYWNHAALVVTGSGGLIEATGRGLQRADLADYSQSDYQLVRIDATEADRQEVVSFGEWALKARPRYGWATIVSITLTVLTGCKLAFFIDGEFICSGLVARAMERTTAAFNLDPVHITPADLAKYYGVPGHQAAVSRPVADTPD